LINILSLPDKKRWRSDWYRLGCWSRRTHWRDPTTARHGDFWLLGFPSGPFHPSL